MKTIGTAAVLAAAAVLLTGCGEKEHVTSTMDGVTLETYGMKYETKAIHIAMPDVEITNQCGEPVTAVYWRTVFYDKDGEVTEEKLMFWQAEKEALADGASIRVSDGRYVLEGKEDPASFTAELTEIRTEADHPLDKIPEEGEYLYEALGYKHLSNIKETPPVRIECGVDQSGWLRTATFEGDSLQEAVDAFTKIKVGAGDAPMVTDNYNYFAFTWDDGSTEVVRVNLRYLEVSANGRYYSYELEDDGAFWGMITENLVDPQDDAPLEAFGTNSSLDLTVTDVSFEPSDKENVLTMHGTLTIENRSKNDLVEASYEVSFLNEDKNVYAHKVYFLEADDLPGAGESCEMKIEADLPEGTSAAKQIRLDVLTVTSEKSVSDNPALPEGEYLYKAMGIDALANMDKELPLMIEVHIDRMGFGKDIMFVRDDIQEAAEMFMKIKVGSDGAPEVTDNYNSVTLLFEDGSEVSLRLNLYALEYFEGNTRHSYELPGMAEFFAYAESKLP